MRHATTILFGTLAVFALSIVQAAQVADAPVSASVQIVTDPEGALICRKKSGHLDCFATSPSTQPLSFRTQKSGIRLYLKRLGFKTHAVLLTPSNNKFNVRLQESDIYFNPIDQPSIHLRRLQQCINEAIRKKFRTNQSDLNIAEFDIIGKIRVIGDKGASTLSINVGISDSFRRKHLRKINRIRSEHRRATALVESLLEEAGSQLIIWVRNALSCESDIEDITLSLTYSKTKLVLSEDDTTFTQHFRRVSLVTSEFVFYTVTSGQFKTGYTTLDTQEQIYSVIVRVPRKSIPIRFEKREATEQIMHDSRIFYNDNRKRIFAELNSETK